MIIVRKQPKHDRTWLYLLAFALVACASYNIEREIEINQLSLPVDYN